MPNEAVEKLLKNILTAKWMGGETLPDTVIVDPGAFCEADFLWYEIEIFSFGFFYSLNGQIEGRRAFAASRSNAGLAIFVNKAITQRRIVCKRKYGTPCHR